jgi:hypothetical protein
MVLCQERTDTMSNNPTPIVIPMEDDLEHTADNFYFCRNNPTCPCKDDQELISDLAALVEAGEVSPEEATSIVAGTAR